MYGHRSINRPTRVRSSWLVYRIHRRGWYDRIYLAAFQSEQAARDYAGSIQAETEIDRIDRGC